MYDTVNRKSEICHILHLLCTHVQQKPITSVFGSLVGNVCSASLPFQQLYIAPTSVDSENQK